MHTPNPVAFGAQSWVDAAQPFPSFVAGSRPHVRPLVIAPPAGAVVPPHVVGPGGGVDSAFDWPFGRLMELARGVHAVLWAMVVGVAVHVDESIATEKEPAVHAVPVVGLHAHEQVPAPVPVTTFRSVGVL
jgi:hypothetical protein